MKSVCILLQNAYDGDVRVRRKAEALVAAGYSVDVLALRPSHHNKAYELNGVKVYTVGLGKKRGTLRRYVFEYVAFFLWACVRLTLRMPTRRYAVVDVNTLPDFLIFAAVFARWMGAKLVLDMHEITPEFYMSKYGIAERSWMVRLTKYLERISFAFADRVVTIHEPIQDLLIGRGLSAARSTVVMNAVDEAAFLSNAGSRVAAVPATPPGTFVMMYHGTLTHIYGLDTAIEAFGLAHHEMPGAEFWILGDGPEKDSLQRLVQTKGLATKVKLLGSVPPADVRTWLDKCDVGVLPMRRDVFLDFSFPNKLSEYIIVGKCVIVPRLNTIRHYFGEEALAYFEPNSHADLARQMVRVYRDGGLRGRLAAAAKTDYAPIRWDVMKERYLKLMHDLTTPEGAATEAPRAAEASGSPR
jgi:glycosyltransferase involved in cell wall biosynthesis